MMQVMATISEQSDPATTGFEISPAVEQLIPARPIREGAVKEFRKTVGRIHQSSNPKHAKAGGPSLVNLSPTEGRILDRSYDAYIGGRGRANLIFYRKSSYKSSLASPWELLGR